MRLRALFFVVFAALVVLSTAQSASAQAAILQIGKTIERRADRPQELDVRTINWDDCQAGGAGDTLTVAATVTGATAASLEVWAGTSNCASDATRTIPANVPGLCWQVASMPLATTGLLSLAVRDIVPHGDSGAGSGLANACSTAASTPFAAGVVTLFFILVDGDISVGTGATLAVRYDLRGPDAPTISSVAPGDTRLFPTWSPGKEADLRGYRLYCEPADATGPELCTSSTLSAGQLVPSAAPRDEVSQSATIGVAEGLSNDVRYACGVAGFDAFGNAGPPSNLVCATPKVGAGPELTGRCQLGRAPVTPGTSVAVLTLLGCLAWRRARARGQRGARDPS